MPNKLTPLYSEIYYKEENYLKVRTAAFKYITPPIVKGLVCWYISILVYPHIPTFLCFYILSFTTWLSYPLSYGFTSSISFTFYALTLTLYKSPFSTYIILFIKSIIPTPPFLSLSLKSSSIFKLLIKGVLCPILI